MNTGFDAIPLATTSSLQMKRGQSYQAFGFQFNGVSQGAAYGDDVQAATNYPLVRITNIINGHVQYARTHDHSTMAVASNGLVSTHFDVSPNQEPCQKNRSEQQGRLRTLWMPRCWREDFHVVREIREAYLTGRENEHITDE